MLLSQHYTVIPVTCHGTAPWWIQCHGKLVAGQGRCLKEVGLETDSEASSCGQRGASSCIWKRQYLEWGMSLDAKKAIWHNPQKQLALVQYSVTSFSAAFTHEL